jgi:hypothetical protein
MLNCSCDICRNHVTQTNLFIFYTTMIRPLVEYACPKWHSSLTIEQSNHIENIQTHALSFMYDNTDYELFCELFCEAHNIETLCKRSEKLCREFLKTMRKPAKTVYIIYYLNVHLMMFKTPCWITSQPFNLFSLTLYQSIQLDKWKNKTSKMFYISI